METTVLETTGDVHALVLNAERQEIKADRNEVVYLNIKAVDKKNRLVPDANTHVRVKVTGEGELIAAGNASPFIEGSIKDDQFNLFQGKGQVIVRSTGDPGIIKVELFVDNIITGSTNILVKS